MTTTPDKAAMPDKDDHATFHKQDFQGVKNSLQRFIDAPQEQDAARSYSLCSLYSGEIMAALDLAITSADLAPQPGQAVDVNYDESRLEDIFHLIYSCRKEGGFSEKVRDNLAKADLLINAIIAPPARDGSSEAVAELISNQKPLDADFAKILEDNRESLYEHAHPAPSPAPGDTDRAEALDALTEAEAHWNAEQHAMLGTAICKILRRALQSDSAALEAENERLRAAVRDLAADVRHWKRNFDESHRKIYTEYGTTLEKHAATIASCQPAGPTGDEGRDD